MNDTMYGRCGPGILRSGAMSLTVGALDTFEFPTGTGKPDLLRHLYGCPGGITTTASSLAVRKALDRCQKS
ncbi:hypothetical protein CENSYa_0622 [Cenarchaeum symbiosum A]|uniref:Uncharacterized protein n=1 Tax=Cenarchaeum symbiosum (strain A) TaxID=414004 RepID=A0RV88_CENSY|nr:hypothetical protein CENSYa_0622 [Cenarchaeum symbiosum A]